ncbi:MAG: hypothetical protein H7Y07_15655 [Pyrinomonadaceae bacterium]|nr:hypothetical protein [Sphingobacteriaceae bacterium]
MNFLSHFYFDRFNKNPHQVIGMVLPDLLKNARKDWSLRPEKHIAEYQDTALLDIYTGWNRHIEVDKHFHCSDFFFQHTRQIREEVTPCLANSPARPFFVAHIALELMLDSLLLTEGLVETELFYSHLKNADVGLLSTFLSINKIDDSGKFFLFLDEFIKWKYLESYRDPEQIVYALNRICLRIWDKPFDEEEKTLLKEIVVNYLKNLQSDYMRIFEEIEGRLG